MLNKSIAMIQIFTYIFDCYWKFVHKCSQGRSQNLNAVPQNFLEVNLMANEVIQKKQHRLRN